MLIEIVIESSSGVLIVILGICGQTENIRSEASALLVSCTVPEIVPHR